MHGGVSAALRGKAPADTGRGVRWESQHITQKLYDHKFSNKHFVPVLPPGEDEASIPFPLRDYRTFCLDADYEDLYRLLTDQPATPAPVTGKLRRLPPLTVPALNEDAAPPAAGQPAACIPNPTPAWRPSRRNSTPSSSAARPTPRVRARLEQTGFVSVVGGSGTGKSSLVAAGVVPALLATTPGADYLRFKPQADPLRQMAEAIDRKLPEEKLSLGKPRAQRLRETLEANPSQTIGNELTRSRPAAAALCDQFEELFTQSPPSARHQPSAASSTPSARHGSEAGAHAAQRVHAATDGVAGQRSFRSLAARTRPDQGRRAAAQDHRGPGRRSRRRGAARTAGGALVRRAGDGRRAAAGPDAEKLFAAGGIKAASRSTPTAPWAVSGASSKRPPRRSTRPSTPTRRCRPPATDCSPSWPRSSTSCPPAKRSTPAAYRPTVASLLDALRSRGFPHRPRPRACGAGPRDPAAALAAPAAMVANAMAKSSPFAVRAEHAAAEWARAGFNARPGSGPRLSTTCNGAGAPAQQRCRQCWP